VGILIIRKVYVCIIYDYSHQEKQRQVLITKIAFDGTLKLEEFCVGIAQFQDLKTEIEPAFE
jgi:hypothetical protein